MLKADIRFDPNKLLKAGLRIVELINQNIEAGVDAKGKPFKKYSKQYAEWKAKKKPQYGGKVNLTLRGLMLNAMGVIDYGYKGAKGFIDIGFDDDEAAERAYWHNISGAGRGRVLRRFLGLQEKQWQDATLRKLLVDAVIVDFGLPG